MAAVPAPVVRLPIARGAVNRLGRVVLGILGGEALIGVAAAVLAGLVGKSAVFLAPVAMVAFIAAVLVYVNLPGHVEIGAEGVRIDWRGGEVRYVPFSDLVRVTTHVQTRGGKRILGVGLLTRTWGEIHLAVGEDAFGADRRVRELASKIEGALEAYRAREEEEAPAEALARGEESRSTWVGRLRAIGTGARADHREAAVPSDRLWRILENPSAPPVARAGAAIALAPCLDREGKERLRVTAEASASRTLRVALERASAEDEVAAEALADLEAEAEARERRS